MKTRTIEVHMYPMTGRDGMYGVRLTYVEGDAMFVCDNHGKGMFLHQAEHLVKVMHDVCESGNNPKYA